MIENFVVPEECNPQDVVQELCNIVNSLEDKIAELAVEHEVDATIRGPYGATRWVVVNDSNEEENYHGYRNGEWQASAHSC